MLASALQPNVYGAVSAHRTIWHFSFTILLRKRGSHAFDVRDEVPLSEERPRMDYLILRKLAEAAADGRAESLRALWPRLPNVTVAEFKSIGWPYRKGDLDRLWGYTHWYYADERNRIQQRNDLCALLIVPSRTPTLDADAKEMHLQWHDLQGGYWELTGGLFQLYVVEFEEVAEQERDDVLRSFGHERQHSDEALRFWAEVIGTKEAKMAAQQMEGYDEVVRRFLEGLTPEQRLWGLTPEQRLAALAPEHEAVQRFLEGLTPEQRLAGLTPEQRLGALSLEEILGALTPEAREQLAKKLQ